MKDLRHVPYEAALKRLRLFYLADPWGYNTHVPDHWNFTRSQPSPTQDYVVTPISTTNRDVTLTNTYAAFVLFTFGINCRLRLSMYGFTILLDANWRFLFPGVSVIPTPFPNLIPFPHLTLLRHSLPHNLFFHYLTWSFIVVLTAH